MALSLLKAWLIGGATCGVVATATATPFLAGRGWTEVLLVAKSSNDEVKLYLQTKVDPKTGKVDETKPKEYELKAQYKGKEVREQLVLCSPTKDKNKYFLLKLVQEGYSMVQKTMEGRGKNCEYARDYENDKDLINPVSIKFFDELQGSSITPPQQIFLIDCKLKNLNDSTEQTTTKNKSSWLITCSKNQYKQTVSEVKIVDQGLFYIY